MNNETRAEARAGSSQESGPVFKNISDSEKFKIEGFFSADKKRALGWTNVTSDVAKINQVEMAFATAYDFKFVSIHGKVSELLEANIELARAGKTKELNLRHIYELLEIGKSGNSKASALLVEELDEDGEMTGGFIDLYDYAHLKRIKDFYHDLYPADRELSDDELEEKYRQGEVVKVEVILRGKDGTALKNKEGKLKKIIIPDLFAHVERPVISSEEFGYYYSVIEDSQTSLQYLSTLRDSNIMGHHSENGGHAQFLESIGGESMYLPVSASMASDYVLADVNKTPTRFRAEGHVHEFGYYEENTGICIGLDRKLLTMFRGAIATHVDYGDTKARTYKNLLGLNSGEDAIFDQANKTFYAGRRVQANKFGRAVEKRGNIYQAMHNHYDQELRERRGYGITDIEIGDKIATDVICTHFAVNPVDWIINFGKVTGIWNPEQAVRTRTAQEHDLRGEPKIVFYAKRPKRVDKIGRDFNFDDVNDFDFGKLTINGITALAKYTKWRMRQGDMPGFSPNEAGMVNIKIVDEIAKKAKSGGRDAAGQQDTRPQPDAAPPPSESVIDYTPYAENIASIITDTYGEESEKLIELLINSYGSVRVESGTITDIEGLINHFKSVLEQKKDIMPQVRKILYAPGDRTARSAAVVASEFINRLKDILLGASGFTGGEAIVRSIEEKQTPSSDKKGSK